jgi:hypothetical protein
VQGCQIFLGPNLPKREKYIKWPQTISIGLNYTKRPLIIQKGRKIYQHFPFQGSPNYTQIGMFGLKINHLATLLAWGGVSRASSCHCQFMNVLGVKMEL